MFQEAWDAEQRRAAELFGQPFNLVTEPNRYGIPTFYELHAWAWKDNPTGAHEDWNPAVLCPGTEGHTQYAGDTATASATPRRPATATPAARPAASSRFAG